ncbi:diguanylate cyclase, partial [Pseudomonas aeruginosa]|uniref:diguanylate cyclase n=1 Tax=Pseudomonas aeruginosa TaxID=287 RepID=UPI003CC5D707
AQIVGNSLCLCRALSIYEFKSDRLLGCVTVSIGVAAVLPSPGSSPEVLLQRADAALYQAKTHGRNRAELATDQTEG